MSKSQIWADLKTIAKQIGLDLALAGMSWRTPKADLAEFLGQQRLVVAEEKQKEEKKGSEGREEKRQSLSSQLMLDISQGRVRMFRRRVLGELKHRHRSLTPIYIDDEHILKLLKEKKYAEIVKFISNNGGNSMRFLRKDLFNEFFRRLFNGTDKFTLKVEGKNSTQFVPVNVNNKARLKWIMGDRLWIHTAKWWTGSDMANDSVGFMVKYKKLSLLKNAKPKNTKNKTGGFFKFLNTTSIDLTPYQIYTTNQFKDLQSNLENCLIFTLGSCGVPENVLNSLKLSYVSGSDIAKNKIKHIAKFIKRNIWIYERGKSDIRVSKTKLVGAELIDVEPIKIAVFQNHYFKFEKTIYSRCSISNYLSLRDKKDFNDITQIDVKGRATYYRRNPQGSKMSSLDVVDIMMNKGLFDAGSMVYSDEASKLSEVRDRIFLDNIESEQRLVIDPEKKEKKKTNKITSNNIWTADTETFVFEGVVSHTLKSIGFVSINSIETDDICILDNNNLGLDYSSTKKVVDKFLYSITLSGKKDAIVYFHNLKYDYFILEKYLDIRTRCEKDGALYNVVVNYQGRKITFRDSLKLLPFGLSKFCKNLKLDDSLNKKEALPYAYYTPDNHNVRISIDDNNFTKHLSFEDLKTFNREVLKCPSYSPSDRTFNPSIWYEEYLKLDCLVLKAGLQKFDTIVKKLTKGTCSIYDSLTISSLTDKYMKLRGCYDGVYEMCGNLRAYVGNAVYGGRVSCNETKELNPETNQLEYKYKRKVLEGKFADYDGCSLYPSAIHRLCRERGLPTGKAKKYSNSNNIKNEWKNNFYSVLTVQITKVNKIQNNIPIIAYKDKKQGSISYTNDCPPEPIIIDSITLQDYIDFQGIEFEILDGVYWDCLPKDANKMMGQVISELYTQRLQYKKSKNKAMANVLKLMLNSAYGKTILKKTHESHIILSRKPKNRKGKIEVCKIDEYIYNNFNIIKSYRELSPTQVELKVSSSDMSYNRGHIGCAILSMSKRIMNEVFDVANDHKLPIYYTDTDSIHMNYDDVPILEDEFQKRFSKTLKGKQLEQFHIDFDLEGAVGDIYAIRSVFLGKKFYLDVLESTDKNGKTIRGEHRRGKGCSDIGLDVASRKYYNPKLDISPSIGMYAELCKPNSSVEIQLNAYDPLTNVQKVSFEFKNGSVSTRGKFVRNISFD